jgi:hypothetical protein
MDDREKPVGDGGGNGSGAEFLVQEAAGGQEGPAPHLRVRGGQLHRERRQLLQTGVTLGTNGHGPHGYFLLNQVQAPLEPAD